MDEKDLLEQESQEEALEQDQNTEDLDWKEAARTLKKAKDTMDYSIENYFKRLEVEQLRTRYNGKERTTDLYKSIMALEV